MLLIDPAEIVEIDHEHGRPHDRIGFRCRNCHFEAVDEELPVRKSGQVVMHGVVKQTGFGCLLLGHVDDGPDAADDFAAGSEDRTDAQLHPVMMAILGPDAKFEVEPTATVFEQCIERGAETVAIIRMDMWQPVPDSSG